MSFSDVLDASARRPDPAPRPRDTAEPRQVRSDESPTPRPDEAKPKAEETKPNTPPGQAKAKPKSEAASNETDSAPAETPAETTSAETLTETAPAETAETLPSAEPKKGKGAAALDWLASLLASGNADVDPTMPKGQMVAAIVVPQNAPEHAAAAANHNVPGLLPVATPAPTQPTPPAPTGTTAAAPTGATPPQTPAFVPVGEAPIVAPSAVPPAPNPAQVLTPVAPGPEFAEGGTAPAPVANSTLGTAPTTPAPAPAPANNPASQTSEPSATAALPVNALVAEILTDDGEAPILDIVTDDVTTALPAPGSTATARPTTTQAPTSGYVAQVVSQEAAGNDTPVLNVPGEGEKTPAVSSATSAALADASPAADESMMPAKSAEPMALATAEVSSAREPHAAEAIAATRSARPPAVPVPEQVVVRIAKAVADGVDRINVKLSPAELGHIDVRMEIGPDGRFQAVFAADRPQTVELLQRDARELARALQEAGLRADTGSLSFNLRGQGGQQGNADAAPPRSGLLPGAAGGTELPNDVAPHHVYRSPGLGAGRVDIRV